MSGFDPITPALEGWFDTPLRDLPDALRQRVDLDLTGTPWDVLSADERRSVALQFDHQHDTAPDATQDPLVQYIAYPKAMKLLSEKLKATPEELAAWVWMGPKDGGIAAYLNANELDPPPRFYYDSFMGEDYLSPLMSCWFQSSDIANFQPTDRYITGRALIQRWSEQPSIHPETFILVKIRESRLMDFHPTHGGTQASSSGIESFPLLETGLFLLSQIKEIESLDFGIDETVSPADAKQPGHLNHDLQMQQRANEIAAELTATTSKVPTKGRVAQQLGKELGIPVETVERRIRAQWKSKKPYKRLNQLK